MSAEAAFRKALADQQSASDPLYSVFVDANAGAGKTSVLTARVARLLLGGAEPSKILCITYTKAAAAEMADRLLKILGDWALADDARLATELRKLEGAAFRTRSPADCARARRLFARALETPGGLKIQTIHSFCENLLRRFPLEAGVAPGFAVIDEKEAFAHARAAFEDVCATATPAIADALARLTRSRSPEEARSLVENLLVSRTKVEDALAGAGSFNALRDRLAARLGLAAGETAEGLRSAAIAAIGDDKIRRAREALLAGLKTAQGFANAQLTDYLSTNDVERKFRLLSEVALTKAGEPRLKFPDTAVKDKHPWTEDFFTKLSHDLRETRARIAAVENHADTTAVLTLLEAASDRYQASKAARAGLDYDDLIGRTRRLLAAADADWVRFKLDQGLDHILLDEAQDTSPAQWKVIEAPLAEFIAGDGARDVDRTIFVVGDQKQSIYSFQGANAELFADKLDGLGKDIAAAGRFRSIPLNLSFRSSPPVLKFVDKVLEREEAREGVASAFYAHDARRAGEFGRVELWPLVPMTDKTQERLWDAPLDQTTWADPRRRLTATIAADIKSRLGGGISPARGRPYRPADFLILVQSRRAIFFEMIRALLKVGAPVAGADKIALLEEAAVEDVLSFASAILDETDDLALAETLKSPFFGFSDADLFDLAYERGDLSLRGALRKLSAGDTKFAEIEEALARAGAVGLEEGAFAFVSYLLETGAPSGRERLFRRLGSAAAEPLSELLRQALDYENGRPRSLSGFVSAFVGAAGEVKRDLEQTSDAVRVMTVHGAKGLEADVVYLLDADAPPNLGKLGPLFFGSERPGAAAEETVPIYSTHSGGDSSLAAAARATAKRRAHEEYRRLFYVAATRARDELIICGVQRMGDPHKKAIGEKTWHALAEDAFADLPKMSGRTLDWGEARRIEEAQTLPVETCKEERASEATATPPLWIKAPAPVEYRRRRVAPSDFGEDSVSGSSFSPLRPPEKFLRGRALHKLLEMLPETPAERRRAAGEALLKVFAPGAPDAERRHWLDEALVVVEDARFAPVFSPQSRAEAAVAGLVTRGTEDFLVSGQIDRLAVLRDTVLLVDYKTNRPPPKSEGEVPDAYAAQLALYRALLQTIYPDHQIEAALLWTYDARLMPISAERLDHAFARAAL